MRGLVIVCIAGCYDPQAKFPTGVIDAAVLDVRDDAAIDAPAVAADAPIDAIAHVEYVATIAECIDPLAPSVAACRTKGKNTNLLVDGEDVGTNEPWLSFMKFEIDGAPMGRTITSVKLRLVATDEPDADGEQSGEVWEVTPFTLASLSTVAPTKKNAVLASSLGAVTQLQVLLWTLPSQVVVANQPLYVGVYPISTQGVNYWNLDGIDPPRLVVDLQ